MDISQLIQLFIGHGAVGFFFKAFSIIFALLYLLFSAVLYRQVITMNRTFETKGAHSLMIISAVQIIVAIAVLFLALFLL